MSLPAIIWGSSDIRRRRLIEIDVGVASALLNRPSSADSRSDNEVELSSKNDGDKPVLVLDAFSFAASFVADETMFDSRWDFRVFLRFETN